MQSLKRLIMKLSTFLKICEKIKYIHISLNDIGSLTFFFYRLTQLLESSRVHSNDHQDPNYI